MCATTLISVWYIYIAFIIAIATQYEGDVHNKKESYVTDFLEAIEELSNNRDDILIKKESHDINETTTDDDQEMNEEYEDWEHFDETRFEKIRRWLPKRHPTTKPKPTGSTPNQTNSKAEALHAERIKYINEAMKQGFFTTLYLHSEVRRIIKDRVVYDEVRRLIVRLEKSGNVELKEKVLKCYRNAKKKSVYKFWDPKNQPNNLVINVLKDPLNDGVIS